MMAPGTDEANSLERISAVLDLSARVGEVIFGAGAGAEDATATMQAITRAYGLKGTQADITHTLITLNYDHADRPDSVSRNRNVKYRNLDYSKLTAISELAAELIENPVALTDARKRLSAIVKAKPLVPWFWRRVGWSLVGAGAAVLIGGDVVVTVVAFLATFVVDTVTSWLDARRVPVFYRSVAGGAIGPIAAAIVHFVDPGASASLVVIATIIMLLAGVTTFGAVHDTLSGFYVTGAARLTEALVITFGLVAGVSGAVLLLARFGLKLTIAATALPGLTSLPIQLVSAAVMVVGFALAVQVPWRAYWAVCVLGALAELLYLLGIGAGLGLVWSAAGAAVGVGLLVGVASHMVRTPSLAIVVAALIPLVPGLTLFRGLLQLADGDIAGLLSMLTAGAIAGALAAGAILTQSVVQFAWGSTRRLQRRSIGPLMTMPIRIIRGKTRI